MIVKIQPPNPGVMAAVQYNEKKMDGVEGIRNHKDVNLHGIEEGHVLVTRNVPDGKTLSGVIQENMLNSVKKRRSGQATKNFAFHMSINPSETDRPLSDKEAVAFTDEIMKALGYEHQPYRIYKHTDIEREHYHVVSCRVDENGKKIKDNFERLVLRQTLKQLAEKYGYSLVLSEEELEDKEREEKKKKDDVVYDERLENERRLSEIPADRKADRKRTDEEDDIDSVAKTPGFTRNTREPVISQIKRLCEDALRWHFTTFNQFQALMARRYNLMVEIERRKEDYIVVFGMNEKYETVTPPVGEDDFKLHLGEILRNRIRKEKMHNRREQKEKIEKLTRAAAAASDSWTEFVQTMKLKGTYIYLSWTKDGRPFGVTYLDRSTRCAWKGSETAVDMKWLNEVISKKNWVPERDNIQTIVERRNTAPSRRADFKEFAVKTESSSESKTTPKGSGPSLPDNGRANEVHVNDANRHSTDSVLNHKSESLTDDRREDKPVELIK